MMLRARSLIYASYSDSEQCVSLETCQAAVAANIMRAGREREHHQLPTVAGTGRWRESLAIDFSPICLGRGLDLQVQLKELQMGGLGPGRNIRHDVAVEERLAVLA